MKMGMPPMVAWQVYPRMGLKGLLTLGLHANMNIKAMATYLICYYILVSLRALCMKTGTNPKMNRKL